MQKCRVCGASDFYKEAGYFFCQTCQTQNENVREEVLELRVDNTTRLRKTRIRQLRSDKSGEELGWTSWELYNFVLIGLTNELIELGVTTEIKLTILQLWATYLGKVEVAFISTRKKCMPKLARRYKKRDAEIIYGKVQSQKKSRKRKRAGSSTNTSLVSTGHSEGTSMRELNKNKRLLATADYDRYLQSQGSSEGDGVSMFSQSVYSIQSGSAKSIGSEVKVQFSSHAKEEARKIKRLSKSVPRSERIKYRAKHISTQYKMSPHIITPMRLWAIIYIALRIHDQPIQLADMLRYAREGHLSYYKLDHLLPPEVSLTAKERNFLTQNVEITHKGMRRIVASMARFLGVWDIVCPDFSYLVSRYCQELGLPKGIQLYTERLIALSPPKMIFDTKKSHIPNYEGRAIAFIIVVLKTLLALDGVTEYQISRIAEKINGIAIDRGLLSEKLFSFQEWQRYIECRKTILVHAHFPTKMKYSPDSDGIDDLYMKFFEFVSSKTNREEAEMKNSKHHLPAELVTAMARHVTGLNIADISSEAVDIFPPSLTPLHSYFQYLLDHPLYDIPAIARRDFYHSKVGYMTRPDSLLELALRCDFKLEIIDANVHFLEKYVPLFEQPRMPGIEELRQLVDVEDGTKHVPEVNENESLNDYLHAKIPCVVKVDCVKKRRYDRLRETFEMNSEIDEPGEEFAFAETRSNGKLAIPSDSDSEDETKKSVRDSKQGTPLLGDKSDERYNLRLSRPELESILNADAAKSGVTFRKAKAPPPRRNAKGRFVKGDGVPVKMTETRRDSASTMGSVNIRTNDTVTEIEIENGTEKELFVCEDISISEFGLDDTDIKNGFLDLDEFNFSDISFLNDCTDTLVPDENEKRDADDGEHRFFNPFKEYWTYHCIFSRVKPKNFSVFERSLPRTFRWLLNECALIVEMSTEDLYEEVCLIETYHSQILAPGSSRKDENDDADSLSKNQLNFILNKW